MSFVEERKATDFRNLNAEIKSTMRRSARAVVDLGFLLRRMAEQKLWTVCYACFGDYLREELHMDYTMANRFIGINKKYSIGGNSPELEPKWADYSQAALIEMLSMPQGLEAEITPDMTVKQIRKVKRAARKNVEGQSVESQETAGRPEEQISGVLPEDLEEHGPKNDPEPYEPAEGPFGEDEIQDAGYRELETAEDVATSQPIASAYGLEKTEYPEGSLLTTVGCGHRYYCFSCAQECDIRQEMRFCQTASLLADPFGCDTVSLIENLKANVGDRCQFVNNSLAFHTRGMNEASPCCKECNEDCEYRCERSRSGKAATQKTGDPEISETAPDDSVVDELAEIKSILKWEQKTLNQYLEVGGLPEPTVFRQKTIVAALAAMVCDMEDADPEPQEEVAAREEEGAAQPELPVFKNNNQRKEWLGAYKDWGLWYRDENIGVEYYKYDFDNGARLIAEVYRETGYHGDYESCFLHLVGGPEPPKGPYGVGKWARHEKYSKHPNSETELVEFLKEMQKR